MLMACERTRNSASKFGKRAEFSIIYATPDAKELSPMKLSRCWSARPGCCRTALPTGPDARPLPPPAPVATEHPANASRQYTLPDECMFGSPNLG